jgi:hypothetical protein
MRSNGIVPKNRFRRQSDDELKMATHIQLKLESMLLRKKEKKALEMRLIFEGIE